MSRFTTSLKVGALTLATVLAAVLILRFLDKGTSSTDGYLVYVLMEDGAGIVKRSQVRVAGIPIGHVEDIRLVDDQARIDIRVNPDVTLYEDAQATKATRNLLGEYFVSISPGTRGKRALKDGDQINTVAKSASPDDILQNMSRIAQTVERITNAIESSVGSEAAQQNMRDTLANLAQVTA